MCADFAHRHLDVPEAKAKILAAIAAAAVTVAVVVGDRPRQCCLTRML